MFSYGVDSTLWFGKYTGFSIREIALRNDSNYLQWCLININGFYLPEETIEYLKTIDLTFDIKDELQEALKGKKIIFLRIQELIEEQQRIKYIKRELKEAHKWDELKKIKERGGDIYDELQLYK
jgi:hypothetical protein